ncbi:MAG TPA: type II secretion system protein GspJ [Gammaproteobacteria bacterium]|nr:type II secretion system protein GspJ [Gammaproteobacteria bacterium]HBF09895.1 type II secretion system protein GspJ [Gammaproteobacteria bacterium]HCK93030.1 type II secretion system protein GspJ [Gammaproteobacteria bacterium]
MRFAKGMTLIELMVSIAIMSVVVAGAYKVYTNLQNAHDRVLSRTRAINDTQRFWHLLKQDLTYALERSIRPGQDSFGGEDQSLFSLYEYAFAGDAVSFQLSRNSGLPNLASGQPQSELRRIAYGFDDKKIHRYQWAYLDPSEDDEPVDMLMLDEIESMSIRYGYPDYEDLEQEENSEDASIGLAKAETEWHWVDQWPLEDNTTSNSTESLNSEGETESNTSLSDELPLLPSVIEVTLETQAFGTLIRVFEVGAPDGHIYSTLLSNAEAKVSLSDDDLDGSNDVDSDTSTTEDLTQ